MPAPTLNLFYGEPDPDRWLPLDRIPRRVLRRLLRGPARIGGQKRVFLNLCAGLERLGLPYRVNDFAYLRRHPGELAGLIGKPFLLKRFEHGRNPLLFGASLYSHPLDDPTLLQRLPVKRVLVPGEWMRKMCEPYWGAQVQAWPVGIDTDRWRPQAGQKDLDVLLYNKILWKKELMDQAMVQPVREALTRHGLRWEEIRYGHYEEADYQALLQRTRTLVFICEHETQGIAYQQALSAGVPILAWTGSRYWEDPAYYPDRVTFGPVSAVPYWDERCGFVFSSAAEFPAALADFWARRDHYDPRAYILENLTLEKAAQSYADHYRAVS